MLNGVNQYVQFDNPEPCLLDPSRCPFGLNLKFNLHIRAFHKDSYVLSCGADDRDITGVAMWWTGNKLNLRVRTPNKEWVVKARYLANEESYQQFVAVEFSWNVGTGLDLYVNGQLEDSSRRFTGQSASAAKTPGACVIGRHRTRAEYTHCAVADLYILFAAKNLVNDFKIDFGELFLTVFLHPRITCNLLLE